MASSSSACRTPMRDWLENRLRHTIKRTLSSILHRGVQVQFRVRPRPVVDPAAVESAPLYKPVIEEPQEKKGRSVVDDVTLLHPSESEPHLRDLRGRQPQPPGARRRAGCGRLARPGLQPAVHLRRRGAGQDSPAQRHRQQRQAARLQHALLLVRAVHQRADHGDSQPEHRAVSQQISPGSTFCSSTTSSSSAARRAPKRSSSTPSTPCTRRVSRSC